MQPPATPPAFLLPTLPPYDPNWQLRTAFSMKESHGAADPLPKTLNVFYKGKYIEMLEETYEKFKQQLLARKTGDTQLPDIVKIADEQVHHLCSYNHYYVKNENMIEIQEHKHNDIYDTDELNHEYEYGIY